MGSGHCGVKVGPGPGSDQPAVGAAHHGWRALWRKPLGLAERASVWHPQQLEGPRWGAAGQTGLPSPSAPDDPLDCDVEWQATSELRQATCPARGKQGAAGSQPAAPQGWPLT